MTWSLKFSNSLGTIKFECFVPNSLGPFLPVKVAQSDLLVWKFSKIFRNKLQNTGTVINTNSQIDEGKLKPLPVIIAIIHCSPRWFTSVDSLHTHKNTSPAVLLHEALDTDGEFWMRMRVCFKQVARAVRTRKYHAVRHPSRHRF